MERKSIQSQLQELEREERVLEMELMDVLTDISTPDNSDVEGEEVEEPTMPAVRQALLEARTYPSRWTPYLQLYRNREYLTKAEKKVAMMKKLVKRHTLAEVMLNQRFTSALNLIEQIYPDDGGRPGLNSLVACHHVINPQN